MCSLCSSIKFKWMSACGTYTPLNWMSAPTNQILYDVNYTHSQMWCECTRFKCNRPMWMWVWKRIMHITSLFSTHSRSFVVHLEHLFSVFAISIIDSVISMNKNTVNHHIYTSQNTFTSIASLRVCVQLERQVHIIVNLSLKFHWNLIEMCGRTKIRYFIKKSPNL